MYKIPTPHFQRIDAQDQFEFTELHEVDCNCCGQMTPLTQLFHEGPFTINKCRECELVFVSPQPSTEELNRYYAYFFTEGSQADPANWNNERSFGQVCRLLKQHVSSIPTKSLLEIGSGYGFFLKQAESMGFQKITGIEPDGQVLTTAKIDLPGVQVINDTFVSVDFGDLQFSTIVMLASLEHFQDPLSALRKCQQLLEDQGVLVIRVPYLEGFFQMSRVLKTSVVGFGAPRHLFDFSPKSLAGLIAKANLQLIDIIPGESELASNQVYYILGRVVKISSQLLWLATGRKYINPFVGSIVALARKTEEKP